MIPTIHNMTSHTTYRGHQPRRLIIFAWIFKSVLCTQIILITPLLCAIPLIFRVSETRHHDVFRRLPLIFLRQLIFFQIATMTSRVIPIRHRSKHKKHISSNYFRMMSHILCCQNNALGRRRRSLRRRFRKVCKVFSFVN